MIFWRILDNKLHSVGEVEQLGFEKTEGLRIPDEYLEKQEFVIMRTCHDIGDWGILASMPRLLKQKYPNCKVYLPSSKLLKKLFGQYEQNWSNWGNPFINVNNVFDNNPYVDGYKDFIEGEVFHDHYRVYDKDNVDRFTIKLIPHPSSQAGKEIEIATGKLDGSELITVSQDYFNSRL